MYDPLFGSWLKQVVKKILLFLLYFENLNTKLLFNDIKKLLLKFLSVIVLLKMFLSFRNTYWTVYRWSICCLRLYQTNTGKGLPEQDWSGVEASWYMRRDSLSYFIYFGVCLNLSLVTSLICLSTSLRICLKGKALEMKIKVTHS